MTDEITETQILDFCEDLDALFKKHQLIIRFDIKTGEFFLKSYHQYDIDNMISDIKIDYYNG